MKVSPLSAHFSDEIAVMSGTTHRLSKQRKNDFKLREDDGSLTNLQTEVGIVMCVC